MVGVCVLAAMPAHAGYTELTAQQAAERLNADGAIVVIDIRTPREFEDAHIDGAVNIDFYAEDFFEKLMALDKTKTYLVHCAVGSRSRRAERAFAAAGLTNVLHLSNGIADWFRAGLPLVRS